MTDAALSVQLYSLREALSVDREETLAPLARLGVRRVEAYDIVGGGAALAESLARHGLRSPSVQVDLLPGGGVRVLATHDQVLGGSNGQVYLGCRFPADPAYAADLATHG